MFINSNHHCMLPMVCLKCDCTRPVRFPIREINDQQLINYFTFHLKKAFTFLMFI